MLCHKEKGKGTDNDINELENKDAQLLLVLLHLYRDGSSSTVQGARLIIDEF